MGAFVEFKDLFGYDFYDCDKVSEADIIRLMYACVKVACRRDNTTLDITFQEFADELQHEDYLAFSYSYLKKKMREAMQMMEMKGNMTI